MMNENNSKKRNDDDVRKAYRTRGTIWNEKTVKERKKNVCSKLIEDEPLVVQYDR